MLICNKHIQNSLKRLQQLYYYQIEQTSRQRLLIKIKKNIFITPKRSFHQEGDDLQQIVTFLCPHSHVIKILEKAEEPEIKLPTSWKKQENSRKNIDFCFIDYAKAFDCVDHNKLWKILKEMRPPDHLTCLLRNLYAGQ